MPTPDKLILSDKELIIVLVRLLIPLSTILNRLDLLFQVFFICHIVVIYILLWVRKKIFLFFWVIEFLVEFGIVLTHHHELAV